MKNKNHIKQFCAFFLAVCMVLEAFVLPGIGSVFAQKTDENDPAAETSIEIVTDDTTGDNTEIDVDDTTEDGAGDTVDSTVGDVTDETTGEATDETTKDAADETTGDITDDTTGAAVDETTGDVTDETTGAATDETVGDNTGDVTDETTGAAAGDTTDETTGAAAGDVTEETTGAVAGDKTENGAGGAAGGTVENGAAGAAGGTLEVGTPPNAQPDNKPTKIDSACPWEDMTDEELAEWLLDETNEEKIKKVLSDEESDDYFSLRDRIEMILDGEDVELASKVYERLLTLGMAMGIMAPIATYANAERKADEYIYFDLAAGNVEIGKDTYSGYVYVGGKSESVTGDHKAENKYYIYQSNMKKSGSVGYYMNTGYETTDDLNAKQNCRVPEYNRVKNEDKSWTEYITNNTDVKAVSVVWESAATKSDREGTSNYITFKSESGYTADVTIDNIWSTYEVESVSRTAGGIGAHLGNNENVTIQLRLKGDNRVGCVHYYSEMNKMNKIIFSNGAETTSAPGSITVADFPNKSWKQNRWNAAIGGADNYDCSDGIEINSGVIYAGTTAADDCTAIGGGGNDFGGVTITGGTVTAVTASTGTAIGGGIGWGSQGGNADVLISGGTVYAYNHGIGPDSGNYVSFVPSVAIGGGSASTNYGNDSTKVTITGGMVYAQSVSGAAIGGGGSGTKKGGNATVNIEGGTVIAKSIGGKVTYTKDNAKVEEMVSSGVSIGGGTGATDGGSVILKVSGADTILRTGSIGGGITTGSGAIGSANVTIENGDITGQVIMKGASAPCRFEMLGGTIHDTNVIDGITVEPDIMNQFPALKEKVEISYTQENGGAVWMQDARGVTNISGGIIKGCTALLGGAVYMEGGTFTLSDSGTIQNNKALRSEDIKEGEIQGYGGGVYVTGGSAEIKGGSVHNNEAQVRGGGLYVKGGDVTVKGGSISGNTAGFGAALPNDVGRGGGVYLEGGLFTMEGGEITDNNANYRGGGIFLTKSPTLSGGIISGNKANDSGGGLCINGEKLELKNPEMKIFGNTAKNGGGVAVLNGAFILDGGNVGMENASPNNASEKGGGVFVQDEPTTSTGGDDTHASVTVSSGNIWHNVSSQDGGGVYLESGDFTMEGENSFIQHNTATQDGGGVYLASGNFTMKGKNASIEQNQASRNGGGIYLHTDPNLQQGIIKGNIAAENGGGMYIQDCLVVLNPASVVSITDNQADNNGAGIYIYDSRTGDTASSGIASVFNTIAKSGESSSDNSVDAVSSPTSIPDDAVGLLVEETPGGHLNFTNNTATKNGGAVCVDNGRFYLYSDHITVTGNKATNGGGVAVLKGNFTMNKGSIGQEQGGNQATNGGGVYVSGGDVWLKGGKVKYNDAIDGGGICVQNGKIYMYGGEVNENEASNDGGGLYVSTDNLKPLVDILSGSVSNNTAGNNGGGVAVISTGEGDIQVNVGVNVDHPDLNLETGSFNPFDYPVDCGNAHVDGDHVGGDPIHRSCPVVEHNTAGERGGGFFLNSPKSHITIYCLVEKDNSATNNPDSNCMDVEGGTVLIGDENFDIHQELPGGTVKGNTVMQGSIMVKGGQVDVYGRMENPRFINDVRVDVQGADDHYLDHRIIETEHDNYKVHYYENFKGDGDTPTGLYIAKQYPDEEHADLEDKKKYDFTIMSSIFSRPGYKIVGWDRDPNGLGNEFKVNETYNLKDLEEEKKLGGGNVTGGLHEDNYLLVIYAIWERKGYVLKFEPNVGAGESYTGSMEDQKVTMGLFDGTQIINENEFKRTGYKFLGWTLSPTPVDGDKVYSDKHVIVDDFTKEDGATVTLYAKWERCTHVGYLTYTADKNVLTQKCTACDGHTATATISAVNCDFDGKEHLATVNYSTNWLEGKPKITYDMEANSEWDDIDKVKEEWVTNPQPLHAGDYTAKITVQDINKTDVSAQTKYMIRRVKWETPAVPEISFKVQKVDQEYKSIIEITKPTGGNVMYKITHLPRDGEETEVDGYTDWQINNEFTNLPLGKYYYFYAKICADRDHLESDHSKSTAYLTDGGNVIYIEKGNGIKVEPSYGGGDFKYTVSAEDGYHLREYKDNLIFPVGTTTMSIGSEILGFVEQIPGADEKDAHIEKDSIIITKSEPSKGTYEYIIKFVDDKVAFHQIILKFSGAAKDASVTSKVTDGQVFSDFNSKETSISRDSAFTTQFAVKDYIPDEYVTQELSFSKELPKGTTVIMKTEGKYWYYELGETKNSIDLTNFTVMGGKNTDLFKVDITEKNPKDFTYQFIVDFSRVTSNNMEEGDLTVNLNLTPNDNHSAPIIPADGESPHISLNIKEEAVFTLTTSDPVGKTATLKCTYNPSAGAASIWNGRKAALVLTVLDTAPADLTLTAVVDGKTTRYTMNENGKFIIPLGEIGTKEVKITPNSNLFGLPENDKNLEFTAQWYVSQSAADRSPLYENSDPVASCNNVTFSCEKDLMPSVRIDGTKRLCQKGGRLEVTVDYKNIPDRGKVTAYLQSKSSNEYIYTGAKVSVGNAGEKVTFSMGQMDSGSYRILVIVEESSGAYVLQVPYYFLIE